LKRQWAVPSHAHARVIDVRLAERTCYGDVGLFEVVAAAGLCQVRRWLVTHLEASGADVTISSTSVVRFMAAAVPSALHYPPDWVMLYDGTTL